MAKTHKQTPTALLWSRASAIVGRGAPGGRIMDGSSRLTGRRQRHLAAVLGLAAILGCAGTLAASDLARAGVAQVSGGPGPLPALAGGPGFHLHYGPRGDTDVNVCSDALAPDAAHCDAYVRTDVAPGERHPQPGSSEAAGELGDGGAYSPAYLQSAYDVASAAAADGGGGGQTVALVDANDDPRVGSDLAFYRSFFGLPACPTGTISPAASGCVFEKVGQTGSKTIFPQPNSSWAVEISLDVEMVSAICPKCQILLVEAANSSLSNLGAAVNEAVNLGANVVSNSYSANEFSFESTDTADFYDHPGVAIGGSAGDDGHGVEFPAASRDVPAVGGTSLTQLSNTGTRDGSETAWSGTGAGCSEYEPKPSWQHDSGCPNRTVADVSAVADPNTGVWVYDTYGTSGWGVYGGTSVAAPIIGSFYAPAGNRLGSTLMPAAFPYGSPGALYDVGSGSDGSCSPAYLCNAGLGYDGPTGLGSPGGSPNSIAAFLGATPATPVVPGAPSGLSATAASGSVALSWTAPSTGTAPITYSVFRSTTSATAGFSPVASGTGLTATTFTDAGLANGTVYYYKVTATNAVAESGFSNVVSAMPAATVAPAPTLPGAPTGLTAIASSTKGILLTWAAPESNGGAPITSYRLYKGVASGKETAAATVACSSSACSYDDTNVTARFGPITYYYEVAAINSRGIGPLSNQASAPAP